MNSGGTGTFPRFFFQSAIAAASSVEGLLLATAAGTAIAEVVDSPSSPTAGAAVFGLATLATGCVMVPGGCVGFVVGAAAGALAGALFTSGETATFVPFLPSDQAFGLTPFPSAAMYSATNSGGANSSPPISLAHSTCACCSRSALPV